MPTAPQWALAGRRASRAPCQGPNLHRVVRETGTNVSAPPITVASAAALGSTSCCGGRNSSVPGGGEPAKPRQHLVTVAGCWARSKLLEGWKRWGRAQMGPSGLDMEMGWAGLLCYLPFKSFSPSWPIKLGGFACSCVVGVRVFNSADDDALNRS
jgi:hypothetical protein